MKQVNGNMKLLVAGVGGQGVVFLTNIIVEAAMLAKIPVGVSEIHGLSQRGGTVTSGIGLGEHCSGFTREAGVDFLFGLEALETQRCIPFLHQDSSVVFGNHQIPPYSVNAKVASYPDVDAFANFLTGVCKDVEYVPEFPKTIDPKAYNVFLLGMATNMKGFPLDSEMIERGICSSIADYRLEKTIQNFWRGVEYNLSEQTT